jgi:hypothetical protein
VQTLSWQSAFEPHFFPAVHPVGQLPPQSTSVSSPFRTWSPQPGVTHVPLVHTPSAQSFLVLHPLSTGHRGQTVPPQSTSDSSPFRALSKQVAGSASLLESPLPPAPLPAVPLEEPPVLAPSGPVGPNPL